MSDAKRKELPAAPRTPPMPTLEALPELLPLGEGAELSFKRVEILLHAHSSMSPEVAHTRMEEARANSETVRYQFAVPAEEETKRAVQMTIQVKYIGFVVVAVVLVGTIGAAVRPEAGPYIATMVGVAATIFGGIFAIDRLKSRRPRPPA